MSIEGSFQWPRLRPFQGLFAEPGLDVPLDSTVKQVGFSFQVPRSGTLTHVGFATAAVASPATVQLRLETVNQGLPSGTLYAANATGSQASPTSSTYYRVPINGGSGVTVIGGDLIAVTLSCPSGTPDVKIRTHYGDVGRQPVATQTSVHNGSVWNSNMEGVTPVQFEYADAPVLPAMGALPLAAHPAFRSFNNASTGTVTGDECGMRLTLPFACRSWGASIVAEVQYRASLRLYSGTTLLRSFAWDYYTFRSAFFRGYTVRWPTPIDLTAGEYILALRCDSADPVRLCEVNPPSSAWMEALGFPVGDGMVTRVDGGAWSAVDTSRMTPMAIEIQQITTVNSGLSGRRRPFIIGA